jgi:hypothetical protein
MWFLGKYKSKRRKGGRKKVEEKGEIKFLSVK